MTRWWIDGCDGVFLRPFLSPKTESARSFSFFGLTCGIERKTIDIRVGHFLPKPNRPA